MEQKKLLGVPIPTESKKEVLEYIKKYLSMGQEFVHIVSLNPENLVLCHEDEEFKKIVEMSQIRIVDGIGVVLAGHMLNVPVGERFTGVDIMEKLIAMAHDGSLSVVLIGGEQNLATKLAKCYRDKYSQIEIVGSEGFKDAKNPNTDEEAALLSIVAVHKPRLLFVAFGSPTQEKWLWKNRALLQGVVCMGVGGAFDFLSGNVARAPILVRRLGLEWLYRLLRQPWRWRRQLRLLKFVWLVMKQKFRL